MSGIVLKRSSHTVLLAQEYTYDDASNVLTHKKDSVTTTYTYDYINQLLSEDRGSYSCDYTYDANGNRLTRTLGSTTEDYICDSGDKLTEIKIGSTTIKSFSYDAAGRTTGITYSGSTTTLAYDYESRVTSLTRSGVTTNSNSYNGLDARYSATDSTGTKTYKRAGASVTAPVLGDGSAVHTPGISGRRSSTTTYNHPGIKSCEAQSSTSQVIGATRQYDAFGNLDSSMGTWKGPFDYGGAFGYQETGDYGLRLLGHRYYDSSTGRFLTRDPAKAGRNWYGYCDANPTGFGDPAGQVKVVVYFYHVFGGGHHGGILVEDNEVGSPTYGTKWSFAGPERYDFWNPGALESKSGKWQPGHQDWKNGGKDFVGSVSLIDDCTEPVGPWLSEFELAEESLVPVQYSPILQAPNEANSNSWCSALINLVGLADEMNRATQKRGGLPWVPGWAHVPTAWRALFSSQ